MSKDRDIHSASYAVELLLAVAREHSVETIAARTLGRDSHAMVVWDEGNRRASLALKAYYEAFGEQYETFLGVI